MEILVIDGQGGRIGQQLIKAILTRYPQVEVTAIGTNSLATSAMLKGGASQGATGENALLVACRRADVILGPLGIVIADALMGEISPAMAVAVGHRHGGIHERGPRSGPRAGVHDKDEGGTGRNPAADGSFKS